MVRKVTDKMIIDILKDRDMQKNPVISSVEIAERLSHIATHPTVTRNLREIERKGLVCYKTAGTMSLYWLPEDFEKRKKKFVIGWE
tara:strand:- start:229 stop:486 length:258 start_codon:yes stop_codon:yes gene_type:complete